MQGKHGPPAVEVAELGKTYPGGVEAVRGISFIVEPGEIFGLLGPNGAGKSTTVGMLTTTVRPSRGRAALAGLDVVREPLAARRVSSVVFQEAAVDRALSGRRNLALHARLWGVPAGEAERSMAALAPVLRLDRLMDRPVGTYSGGERRRLELARALLSRPQVLFLDEPSVGLDPRVRAELLDVVAGLGERGETTVVLTTHYLEEAERLCSRLGIVQRGELVALGSPQELRATLGDALLELRLASDPERAVGLLGGEGREALVVGATLTLPTRGRPPGALVRALVEAGLAAGPPLVRRPTLEDVYLRLTGGGDSDAVLGRAA